MKKLILFTLLAISAIAAKCQSPSQGAFTGVYKWTKSVLMIRCDQNGKTIPDNSAISSIADSKFIIYNVLKDSVVIKMYDYTEPVITKTKETGSNSLRLDDGNKLFQVKDLFFKYNFDANDSTSYYNLPSILANTRNYGKYQLYFKVSTSTFTKNSKHAPENQNGTKIAGSLALGAINYPFKYRLVPGKSDFSGAFNIGAAIGYKMAHDSVSKWTITLPLLAFSITNVNIDSVSATRNQAQLKSTNNFSAISFSTGIIAENNKIQIGLFFGLDHLNRINNLQYGWIYQNKPWFSIGFGYSIFSSETATTKSTDSQQ